MKHVAMRLFIAAWLLSSTFMIRRAMCEPFEPCFASETDLTPTSLTTAAADLTTMRSLVAEATAKIQQARKTYWSEYAKGDVSVEAKDAFVNALAEKDAHFLGTLWLIEGLYGPKRSLQTAMNTLSGDVDGGIRPEAQRAYGLWVERVRTELGVERGQAVPPGKMAQLKEAIARSREAYMEYVKHRDLAEFGAAGMVPPGVDPGDWTYIYCYAVDYARNAGRRDGLTVYGKGDQGMSAVSAAEFAYLEEHPFDVGIRSLAFLKASFGLESVSRALREVSALQRTPDGRLVRPYAVPVQLGDWSDTRVIDAVVDHAVSTDARGWYIAMAFRDQAHSADAIERSVAAWDKLLGFASVEAVSPIIDRVKKERLETAATGKGSSRLFLTSESVKKLNLKPGLANDFPTEAVLSMVFDSYEGNTQPRSRERLIDLEAKGFFWARAELAQKAIRISGAEVQFVGQEEDIDRLMAHAQSSCSASLFKPGKASFAVGMLIEQGRVPGGGSEAAKWFIRGAKLEDPDAMGQLAYILAARKDLIPANDDALEFNSYNLAKRAADERSVFGHFALGVHYENGIGVASNTALAQEHYLAAADQGHPLAIEWCKGRGIQIGSSSPSRGNPQRAPGNTRPSRGR